MPWRRPLTTTAGPRSRPWVTSSPSSARTSIPATTAIPSSATLLTGTTLFEINRRSPGDGKPGVLYARDKRHPPDRKPRPAQAALQTADPAADGDPSVTPSEAELRG